MGAPLKGHIFPTVIHDTEGDPISDANPLPVSATIIFPALASVAINDAGAGTTELSVKVDAAAIPGTDGSALIGAKDAAGAQRSVRAGSFDDGAVSETLVTAIIRAALTGRDSSAGAGSRNVPIESRNADVDGDFASSLIGMLVNSRLSGFDTGAGNYTRIEARDYDAVADVAKALKGILTNSRLAGFNVVSTDWNFATAGTFDDSAASETQSALNTRAAVTGRDGSAGAGSRNVTVEARDANADGDFAGTLFGLLVNSRESIFDGTDWNRWEGGVDNSPAPSTTPVGAFIAGVARTALAVYADGDVAVPTFDTSGRLQVLSTAATGSLNTMTMAAPTFATVGVASGSILAAAAGRKGLVLTVTTAGERVSFGFGAAAVLNSGITIFTAQPLQLDADFLTTQEVFAIASAAGVNVAIQQGT